MSAVILALPDIPETATHLLEGSARLAQLTGAARINILAIRTPPMATIMLTEEILTPEAEQRIRSQEQQRADVLRAIYAEWSRSLPPNVAAGWIDLEGMADHLVEEWGQRADFIVVSRPHSRQNEQDRRALNAALFRTGRPVLVVPAAARLASFGRCVAIAWRNDERTIQAVLAGLRCMGQAEETHVLAGSRDASNPPRLPEILEEHGIPAKLHVLPITRQQAFGESLLRIANQLGADLLIMGAFVHHPLRTLILGGVTRYMLDHADIPVLMRH